MNGERFVALIQGVGKLRCFGGGAGAINRLGLIALMVATGVRWRGLRQSADQTIEERGGFGSISGRLVLIFGRL